MVLTEYKIISSVNAQYKYSSFKKIFIFDFSKVTIRNRGIKQLNSFLKLNRNIFLIKFRHKTNPILRISKVFFASPFVVGKSKSRFSKHQRSYITDVFILANVDLNSNYFSKNFFCFKYYGFEIFYRRLDVTVSWTNLIPKSASLLVGSGNVICDLYGDENLSLVNEISKIRTVVFFYYLSNILEFYKILNKTTFCLASRNSFFLC